LLSLINPATFVFTFNPLKINELHQIFIVYLIAGLIFSFSLCSFKTSIHFITNSVRRFSDFIFSTFIITSMLVQLASFTSGSDSPQLERAKTDNIVILNRRTCIPFSFAKTLAD